MPIASLNGVKALYAVLLTLVLWVGCEGIGHAKQIPASILDVEVVASPRVTVVQRVGITGGGYAVIAGDRILNFYPNHPDDYGITSGIGSAISTDGGLSWTKGRDNWPMTKMVDLWAQRFKNGDLFAFGIKWVPPPESRCQAP